MKIALILMAAGASTRFGGKKLHATVGGRPLFEWSVDRYAGMDFYPKVLVTGDPVIQAYGEKKGFETVLNTEPEEGASRTIRLGMEAVMRHGTFDGVMFAVSDQPLLRDETVERLTAAFERAGRNTANAVVCHGEKAGNPCIIGFAYAEELKALTGDRGGKAVIRRYPEEIVYVEVTDSEELEDVDYREDAERLNAVFGKEITRSGRSSDSE